MAEEAKYPWPSAYPEVGSVNDFDYLMTGRNGQPLGKIDKDKYKQYLTITGQRMKAVPPGALPAGPSDKEMYMDLKSPGTWTYSGVGPFVNSTGEITTLWWNKVTWGVDDRLTGLKGADGKTIEPWTAKVFAIGSSVYYLEKIWYTSVATLSTDIPGTSSKWVEMPVGKTPIDNLTSTSVTSPLSANSGKVLNDKVENIIKITNLTLTFNKSAFDVTLTEIVGASYVNNGAIVDVTTYQGKEIDIYSNAYNTMYCGWKDSGGAIISVFQTSTNSTAQHYITKVPANAKDLYISRWATFATTAVVTDRKYASLATEAKADSAFTLATNNGKNIDLINKEIGFSKFDFTMTFGRYYNNLLVATNLNTTTSTSIYDVTIYQGKVIEIWTKSHGSAYCGWKDSGGAIISIFQTSTTLQGTSLEVPANATQLYISNFEASTSVFDQPFFIYRSKSNDDLTPYTRRFNFTTLGTFFKKLALKTKTTPINVLFGGNSITNFQNSGTGSTDYPVDSLTSPAFMYNKNTFTYKIWQYLNPGALDNSDVIIAETGNIKFRKANDASVTKSGTWISNYTGSAMNSLGTYNSAYPNSIQELLHSKTLGDYMEITVPVGAKGFAIVCKKFTGTKTDGTTSAAPSTATIHIDGVLRDTVSLVGDQTMYFEYTFASTLVATSVIRITNAENKWLPVWGFEWWTDNCIRPINSGKSSSTIGIWYAVDFQKLIVNFTPDLIIHEANIINDSGGSLDTARANYKIYFDDVQARGIPIVMLITHDQSVRNANRTNFALMVIELCKAYNIPYINVWKYLDDKFLGGTIPSYYYIDGTHLATAGHTIYNSLLKSAFNKKY